MTKEVNVLHVVKLLAQLSEKSLKETMIGCFRKAGKYETLNIDSNILSDVLEAHTIIR